MNSKTTNKNRVGEKYITNEGCEVEIIEYFSATNCTVRFMCGLIRPNIFFNNVKKGNIKNPHHPSVYNVGFIGVGKYLVSIKRKKKQTPTVHGIEC